MPALSRSHIEIAAGGMQQALVITSATGLTALQLEAVIGKTLVAAGALPLGTFLCDVDVTGLRKLEVRVRLSTFFAACTPSVFSTLLDGVTSRKVSTPAGVAMAVNTEQVLAFADGDLLGERILRVTIVTTAANNVFDRAELSGL